MRPNPPMRKRMKRREIPRGARFITCSCQRRLPLFKNPAIAAVFVEAMARGRRESGFELFAWVVMPEHVHLLVRPPEGVDLARVLWAMKLSVSKQGTPEQLRFPSGWR